jgi:hypothetical protein
MNTKVKDAIQVILNELNGGNRKEIAATILDTVRSEHRTLQQLFWSAILVAQIGYAESRYDGRNEVAVTWAKKVKEVAIRLCFDMGFPYI